MMEADLRFLVLGPIIMGASLFALWTINKIEEMIAFGFAKSDDGGE